MKEGKFLACWSGGGDGCKLLRPYRGFVESLVIVVRILSAGMLLSVGDFCRAYGLGGGRKFDGLVINL